jgi:WD40 repeat protein
MDNNKNNRINKDNEADIPDDISVEEIEADDNDFEEYLVDENEYDNIDKEKDDLQIIVEKVGENLMDVDDKDEHYHDDEEVLKKEYDGFKTDGEIYSVAMNDKGIIVIGDGEDTTYFFDANKKELIKKEKINKDSVTDVFFSNDFKFLATASLDGSVNVWETENYTVIKTVNGSFSDINVNT